MSWKLAELKWRQEAGLYESRWERRSTGMGVFPNAMGPVPEDRTGRLQSCSGATRHRPLEATCEAETGLGNSLQHTHTFPASPHAQISPCTSAYHLKSSRSTVPLIRSSDSTFSRPDSQRGEESQQLGLRTPATRTRSCSAPVERYPAQFPPLALDLGSPPAFETSERSPLTSAPLAQAGDPDREEVQPLLENSASGLSSSFLTEKLLWPTPSHSLLFDQRHSLETKDIDSPTYEYLNQFLAYEGELFEILNPSAATVPTSVVTPEDSSQSHWASTESKHRSQSLLLPLAMAAPGITGTNGTAQPTQSSESTRENGARGVPPSPPPNTPVEPQVAPYVSLHAAATRAIFQEAGNQAAGGAVQPSQNSPANAQQAAGGHLTSSIANGAANGSANGGRIHTAGPPPEVPLPSTPAGIQGLHLRPAFVAAALHTSSSSGQYGHTSDVLNPSGFVEVENGQEQASKHVWTRAEVVSPTHEDSYRGPSLPDIVEDTDAEQQSAMANHMWLRNQSLNSLFRSEAELEDRAALSVGLESVSQTSPDLRPTSLPTDSLQSQHSIVARKNSYPAFGASPSQSSSVGSFISEATAQPLLASQKIRGNVTVSSPRDGEGSLSCVARDTPGDFQPQPDARPLQDQDWETTEEESTGCNDLSVLKVEVPEAVAPSLPSTASVFSSKNVVSNWDPLSVKQALFTRTEDIFTDRLEAWKDTSKEEDVKKVATSAKKVSNSLPDSQNLPDSCLQIAPAPCPPEHNNSNKFNNSISTGIELRRINKPALSRVLKMPSPSTISADGLYETNTEPFPLLEDSQSIRSVDSIALLGQQARIYYPPPRLPRQFPNACLTLDRAHRVGTTNLELLRVQHIIGERLIMMSVACYIFGGFYLLNSIAERGAMAGNAMTELSRGVGYPVVASVALKEAVLARKIEKCMIWGIAVLFMTLMAVLAWLLAEG